MPALPCLLIGLTALTWASLPAGAFTLRVDFNFSSTSPTQSGWDSLTGSDTALGDSWSKNFTGGIGIDVDPIGAITLDQRDRSDNGGGAEDAMWRDFLFANGSTGSIPGSGLRILLTGLAPGTTYPIRIWGWDDSSNGNRRADWSGGGAGPVTLSFPDSPDPSSLNDYTITLECTTDGSGSITLTGIVAASNPSASHNVFINGLEIGNPVSIDGPTGISITNTVIARTVPIGTLVGALSTSDPTPGDSFTYSLVGGAGSDHNGQFALVDDRLETDRDLSVLVSPLLVRIRSTDLGGEWIEAGFSIELLDDSDLDGLVDSWELTFFADLTVATGDDDNDGDTLTNREEQARGTSPLLADTDGDGLNDSIESGSGIFTSPADPGSSPLLADTDGDGIGDAEEISLANGFITDPNRQDTDGDGFPDPLEIAEGTDPTNAASFPNTLLPLRLNEILARNDTGIDDGFGTREDWIEIYNPNPQSINLDAYFLTDNPALLTKWSFPAVTIPGNGYLLVFASGKDVVDPGGRAHTSFQLAAGGEYLAIVRPDGITIDDAFSPGFPEQFTDISYGRQPLTGAPQFYNLPTPGLANPSAGFPGVVKDTNYSPDRGFYDAAFPLVITSATPGATIRYTTDGSKPTPTSGIIFNPATPIPITTTTTVRAIAYLGGWLPTNVDTHTYLFADDVAHQPANPPGWPANWGYDGQVDSNDGAGPGIVPADYEMDPRVVNNTNGLGIYTVQEALLDIPTVAISMAQDDFTGPSNGIYTHPASRAERECAVEYILPDGTPGFQEDCKIEIHGNSSRTPWRMQKHSLRLTFSSSAGTPKLRYPLFPDSDVEEFNKLVLRACFTDSWALNSWSSARYRPNDSQYLRDVWMKDSLAAMGQPSSHGNFVHLYVNGLYFGLHNLTERIEDDFFADHLGGNKADWQINEDLSTSPARWTAMMAILNGNIAGNAAYNAAKAYLDMENFADYMLLHFYADSEDWPHHNGYAAANPLSGDGRFRFFVWDQEIALDKFSWNRYGAASGAGAPFQRLRLNQEFRILFADRVQKHLFNRGALSETESIARYMGLANRIDKAIVAESARWGDVQASTPYGNTAGSSNNIDDDYYPPTINNPIYFTREQHWAVERDNVVGYYLPKLHNESEPVSIINELRANSLFPSIDAPVLSRHGGVVPSGFPLILTALSGDIFFTTDGSDPRLVGGSVSPGATMLPSGGSTFLTTTGTLRTRARNGAEWSALTEAAFIVGIPASSATLAVSEIFYNPPGALEDTEFIELMNIDPSNAIDLTNVSLTGVSYTFPAGFVLAPLERVVIVRNQVAFAAAYDPTGLRIAPGDFGGTSLSNDGEEIRILAQDGLTEIRRFTYDDQPPWPTSADGEGYSLVLVAPQTNPAHGDPFNWRPSTALGGNPGASDAAPPFSGDPGLDLDHDRRSAFLEHALGTSDLNPDSGTGSTFRVEFHDDGTGTLREYLTIAYRRNLAADDVLYEAQVSTSLAPGAWQGGSLFTAFVSESNNGDGTSTVTHRSLAPFAAFPREFIRLEVTSRP